MGDGETARDHDRRNTRAPFRRREEQHRER